MDSALQEPLNDIVTELLIHWGNGDESASSRLCRMHAGLRRLAAHYMRGERTGHMRYRLLL
jgi:hypothetical protein